MNINTNTVITFSDHALSGTWYLVQYDRVPRCLCILYKALRSAGGIRRPLRLLRKEK